MEHYVKILSISDVANNVRSFLIEKPVDFTYEPGGRPTDVATDGLAGETKDIPSLSLDWQTSHTLRFYNQEL